MRIQLEIIYNNTESVSPQRSRFEGKMLIIGRQGADILVDDPLCSKQHAKLYETSDNQLCLEDLNSKNGTFILGEKISKRLLNVGDKFKMGSTEVRIIDFQLESSSKPLTSSLIKNDKNKLFEAMPEDERKQFSNYVVKEESKSGSQLNEILRRLKKSAE